MASARQIRDEIMTMKIVVNSDPAQKAIYELSKKTSDYKERNIELKESLKQTAASFGKNSEEYKKLTLELSQNKLAISANEKEMERLRSEMDISKMTMQQLRKEASLLRTNLDNMVPGSEQSRALQTQLTAVNARMAEVRTGANATGSSFQGLSRNFSHYTGLVTAGIATLVGFGLSVQKAIDLNNKLSDAQTGVAKTVNMTTDEVRSLTKEFQDFDTRTSKVDLLKIAETGGRLGIGKDQIKDFVREVDKANVALGDGFAGGVEAVTDTLGKLKNLYRETKDLDMVTAINQVGSAMNELGANGAASEQNIGEFALRIGSLPDKLKPTIAETLALGAAFEESGIDAERSSTAYSTFIRSAAVNAEKFAKVMNISKKEVEDLMNTDPLEFFLKFSEGAKGLETTELAKMLEYLKINDQFVIKSIGAASENTDRFRNSINLSNEALIEATSLTEEFNKVNNNTAAIFDKVKNKLLGVFTNEFVAKSINKTIGLFALFIGANEEAESKMSAFGRTAIDIIKIIAVMVTALFGANLAVSAYNLLLKESILREIGLNAIQKTRAATTAISTAVQTIYNVAVGLGQLALGKLFGATTLATAGQMRLNAAMASNPIGAVVLAITVLVGTLYLLKKRQEEVAIAEKERYEQLHRLQTIDNNAKAEGEKAVKNYKNQIDLLVNTIQSEISTKKQREQAYKALIKIHPDFMGTVDKEFRGTKDLIQVYKDLAVQVDATARAKAKAAAKQSIYDDIEKARIDYVKGQTAREQEQAERNKLREKYSYSKERGDSAVKMFGSFKANNEGAALLKIIADREKLIKDLSKKDQQRIATLQKAIQTAKGNNRKVLEIELNSLLGISGENADSDQPKYNTNLEKPEKEKKLPKPKKTQGEKDAEKELKEFESLKKKLLDAAKDNDIKFLEHESDFRMQKINQMEDGYEKELAKIEEEEYKKRVAINKNMYLQADYKQIESVINKTAGDEKALYEKIRNDMRDSDAHFNRMEIKEIEENELKKKVLKEKYQNKKYEDKNKALQIELGHLKREHDEEIAGYTTLAELKAGLKGRIDDKELQRITTWAQGKEALNKIYQKRELDLQVAHLEAMVKLYEGLDLGVLTPEQRKEVMNFLDEAGNKIAEFKAKAAGINQDDKSGLKKLSERSVDILGFTPEDWEAFYDNLQTGTDKLATLQMGVGALQNAFGAYYQFVAANEKKQLQQIESNTERKKRGLKTQLDQGYINQETYKKLTLKADQDLDKKKAELEAKAAKRERNIQIASTIANTAMAIMKTLATTPFPLNLIMSAVVGGIGALQLATIMRQPLPQAAGFEDGFGMEYPITREQDGKRFNVRRSRLKSGLVDRPTHFIAGENNKVEMVVDNPTWTSYPPQLKNAIYAANARANGFESGFNTKGNPTQSAGGNDEIMIRMMSLMSKNIEVLEYIRDTPPIAIIQKNARNGKEVDEMREEYLNLKNKNKH